MSTTKLPKHFAPLGLLGPPHHITQACLRYAEDYALAAVAQAKPAPAPEQLTDADLLDLTPERDFGLTPEIEAYIVASMRAAIAKATGGQA
jgi:hypothetical protein